MKEENYQGHILIVGAGIAGLTTAFLLQQLGYNIEIIEKASAWNAEGGAITLMPNGMRLLHEIGVGNHLEEKGNTIKQIKITDVDNRLLSCFNVEQYATPVAKTITIHRSILHETLRTKLIKTPVHFNTTLTSVEEQGEKVKITFFDKRICFYDLVIGCDGMYSSVRQALFQNNQLNYAGYICWRFICNTDHFFYEDDTLTEMWGQGKRVGIVPLRDKKIHCFASINTNKPEQLKNICADHFRSLFREFKGIVPQLLQTFSDNDKLWFCKLEDVHLKNWISNRVVLMGDAAHGMTPNLTQGASMAIEDAVCLYNELKERRNICDSLPGFFNQRKQRVLNIQRKSSMLGKIGQWQSPFLTGIRNYCWKNIPDRWIQKDFENLLIR